MKFFAIFIVLGVGCFIASGLHAEIYSWTDEKGAYKKLEQFLAKYRPEQKGD